MMDGSKRLKAGAEFGTYTLTNQVGRGASGEVWRAVGGDKSVVALKIRRRGDAAMDRRFIREFESLRSLRLPGVVRVYEAGIEEQHIWFSMDLIDGTTFYKGLHAIQHIQERVDVLIERALQLMEIVAALHQAGFVHRDIKPSNVLVNHEGEVRVLDFGIARFFAAADGANTTHTGAVLGTIPFMAPEQLSGLPNDEAVDIFACGLMIYEGIMGRRSRPAVPIGWIPRTCMERLPALVTLERAVPRGLSRLVERMLSVEPENRPSAAEVTRGLRRAAAGHRSAECPEPTWVEPGNWLVALEGLIGQPNAPSIWILNGPAGSGRSRTAEQLHRLAIMQGVWPVHVRCRFGEVGGPLLRMMTLLLNACADETRKSEVVGEDAPILRRMWPGLNLPGAESTHAFPSVVDVASAVARCMARASTYRPMLVVVHDLEQIDPITALGLGHLGDAAGASLGLLMLQDPRWATRESKRCSQRLRTRNGAGQRTMPQLSSKLATELAGSLCPHDPPKISHACTPLQAVQIGLAALAAWRNEPWLDPGDALWPLAVRNAPVPTQIFELAVGSSAMDSPWVRRTDAGVVFAASFAQQIARSRLADRADAARRLVEVWSANLSGDGHQGDIAVLSMLGDRLTEVWFPAARAALKSEHLGQYADARRWLFLVDTVPRPKSLEQALHFDLSLVRGRVALRSEVGIARTDLLEACERGAATVDQTARARLLRSEFELRKGHATRALVAALRVASNVVESSPHTAVSALIGAALCRFVLGQPNEAPLQLDKARMVLDNHPNALLSTQVDNLRAECFLRQNQLQHCRKLSARIIQSTSQIRYVRGGAFAAARLSRVLRMLGRRREAEHQIRSARDGFVACGDTVLNAETGLSLATLLVERGDTMGARHLLDESIRHIRGLHLDHLLPVAMRVALDVAIFQSDPGEASVALAVLKDAPERDPEIPSVLVRWWRIRGDIDRAMDVSAPSIDGYGKVLWHVERARVAMTAGWVDFADEEATAALEGASDGGFEELKLYARLILGVVIPESAPNWPRVMRRAASSMRTEVYLGALEMDARRLVREDKRIEAFGLWRTLWARSRELGYQPGVEEAQGWLATMKADDTTVVRRRPK